MVPRSARFTPTPVGNTYHYHSRGCQSLRFTPTPVGNTRPSGRNMASISVHPHACGEHIRGPVAQSRQRGSPPRLWGTRIAQKRARNDTVHPHACGEHGNWRMRTRGLAVHPHACGGTLRRGAVTKYARRFTPTPVGNTPVMPFYLRPSAVHPHACGEHRAAVRYPRDAVHPHACGEHCTSSERFMLAPVHPHACGEHGGRCPCSSSSAGSPPRLWGTPCGMPPLTND